ncbi:MAG: hypothetical protein ACI82I_002085 [Gammaproteobacteria bacterium]|jgi:hypothetical protein
MTDARDFFALIWLTLVNPELMARRIMQQTYGRNTLWMGVGLVSILSVVLVLLVGIVTSPVPLPLGLSPMMYGLTMACVLIILTMALYLTGHMLGGKATFPHAFAAVIWLEMTALCVRSAQAFVSIVSPSVAGLLSIVGLVALLRVLVTFVNETQRFDSQPRALATIVIAILGIGFGFGFFLTVIGVSAQLEI